MLALDPATFRDFSNNATDLDTYNNYNSLLTLTLVDNVDNCALLNLRLLEPCSTKLKSAKPAALYFSFTTRKELMQFIYNYSILDNVAKLDTV
jgi:hypothetical protein